MKKNFKFNLIINFILTINIILISQNIFSNNTESESKTTQSSISSLSSIKSFFSKLVKTNTKSVKTNIINDNNLELAKLFRQSENNLTSKENSEITSVRSINPQDCIKIHENSCFYVDQMSTDSTNCINPTKFDEMINEAEKANGSTSN